MSAKWPLVRLGDVLKPVSREESVNPIKQYRMLGIRLDGRGPFMREVVTGAQTAAAKLFRVAKDDFIYSRLFACRGAFGVVSAELDNSYVSGEFPTFLHVIDRLDTDFLRYWFRLPNTLARVVADCTGSTPLTRNRFKEHFFLALEIPLPPLAEQCRIVARIEGLTAQIEEARALRQQAVEDAEALRSSVSARIFEPKAGWSVITVGEFCEPPQYGYTESASEEAIGPHFLRITDIQNGQVDWDRVPYCHCPDPSKYLLRPGDLVFARTGATTGKSYVIYQCPETVFASYLIRLRVREKVSVDYLYRYFQSPSYWEQITDKKTGTGQPNLNGSKLRRLKVPVPSPDEQRRIVAELDKLQSEVDALKSLQAETTTELDALLPSILDRAFKGEL